MADFLYPGAQGGGGNASPDICEASINVEDPIDRGGRDLIPAVPPTIRQPIPIRELPPKIWPPIDEDPRLPEYGIDPRFPGGEPYLPIRNPGQPGFGYTPISRLPGLLDELEDPDRVEEWNEVDRTTSNVDVSGVTIERIESVTFEKPSGAKVVLNFNN
jgi:hypothetical protein